SNTINLPSGTVGLTLGELLIRNNLTINGAGGETTVINGRFQNRICEVFNGFTVAINDVTLANGMVAATNPGFPARGGSIFNAGSLTLTNDTILDNEALGAKGVNGPDGVGVTLDGSPGGDGLPGGDAQGGALFLDNVSGASLTIINCQLRGNIALQGQGGAGGRGQAGFSWPSGVI